MDHLQQFEIVKLLMRGVVLRQEEDDARLRRIEATRLRVIGAADVMNMN